MLFGKSKVASSFSPLLAAAIISSSKTYLSVDVIPYVLHCCEYRLGKTFLRLCFIPCQLPMLKGFFPREAFALNAGLLSYAVYVHASLLESQPASVQLTQEKQFHPLCR